MKVETLMNLHSWKTFFLWFFKAPLSPSYGSYGTGWGLWGFASELDFNKGDKIICKVFLLTIVGTRAQIFILDLGPYLMM